MTKLVIFTHHFVNDFVKWNFNTIKKLNPSWDVISVGFDKYDLIDGSIKVCTDKYPKNDGLIENYPQYEVEWSQPDILFYETYFTKPFYDKYLVIEWDCVSNVSIETFFPKIEEHGFLGNNVSVFSDNDLSWEFIKIYRQYGGSLNNLASYGQSCCLYFCNDILKQISEEVVKNKHLYNNMLSELRGGTLVRKFIDLNPLREDIRDYFWWNTEGIKFDKDTYFYHPIKSAEKFHEHIKQIF